MKVGALMFDEKGQVETGETVYVIFLGYNQWNEIMVMYPDGFVYQGCELDFKEIV
jgi:hypothetical protein